MMPWFIWKGKNSLSDFGLWISKLPTRVRAEERNEAVEIPGMAGELILLEGEDIYSAYSSEMVVTARNTIPLDPVIEWLRGSGDLIISTDPEKAYSTRIVGEVSFERVGNNLQQATIPLRCQPFRKAVHSQQISVTGASATIFNPGDVASKPKVSITGSGNNTITIGGKSVSFTGISDIIVVDCKAQIITKGTSIWTGSYTGELWSIPVGSSTVTQTGSMTIAIDPDWGWF